MYEARVNDSGTISMVGVVFRKGLFQGDRCLLTAGHISSRDSMVVVSGGRRYIEIGSTFVYICQLLARGCKQSRAGGRDRERDRKVG
jgi:hypothetical protein